MAIRRSRLPLVAVCLAGMLITHRSTAFVVPMNARIQQQQRLGSLSPFSSQEPSVMEESQCTQDDSTSSRTQKDLWTVLVYGLSCVALAVSISMYQDYDCSHLKPLGVLRPQALYGMGQGRKERLLTWESTGIVGDDNTLQSIPSYNEILQRHYQERVPMWHQTVDGKTQISVNSIKRALEAVQLLKQMAQDYQWTEMQELIRQPVLTSDLEEACAVLRRRATPEARDEIGFDWGSCAWRHCGAQADAQESLAELYNLIGVLEPFECAFCLDIVERSIRDILSVSSSDRDDISPYVPYQAKGVDGGDSALDMDYLEALELMRRDYSTDD